MTLMDSLPENRMHINSPSKQGHTKGQHVTATAVKHFVVVTMILSGLANMVLSLKLNKNCVVEIHIHNGL